MRQNLYYIPIFLIIFSVKDIACFKCGADDLKLNPFNIESTEEEKRRDLDSSYQPIKIGVDFTTFKRPSSMSTQSFEKVKDILSDTLNEFKKFLYVQHKDIDLSDYYDKIKESCELDNISGDYVNFLINNDIIVFPQFDDLDKNVIAAAAFCLTYNNRPVAGVLFINKALSFEKINTELYMKNVLLHELSHILVFHPALFQNLNMIGQKNSIYYITSTKALLKARQHFNCPSLQGIPLEDQGGTGSVGSHWEARHMLGDLMISTDYIDTTLSDITLALFEDSGFYKVNYYSGGLFKFGKNKGCNFLESKCINIQGAIDEDFCDYPSKPMCSSTRTYKGFCGIYDYSDTGIRIPSEYQYFSSPYYGGFMPANFCPVCNARYDDNDYYPGSCKVGASQLASDYGEKIGDSSFCFLSSLLPSSSTYNSTYQPICYEVECDNTNKQIIVTVGSAKAQCPTSGGNITLSGFIGTITCPKYIDICDFKDNKICNEMIDCLNKNVMVDEDTYNYDPDDEDFTMISSRYSSGNQIKINNFILFLLLLLIIFYN